MYDTSGNVVSSFVSVKVDVLTNLGLY